MKTYIHKKAFTLLEVIFVIVILGIVASIGSSIIVQVYESYIMQRAVHRASIKTELAINQLSNRLAYRIDSTVTGRRIGAIGNVVGVDILESYAISTQAEANLYNIFEWIGYDNDGFSTSEGTAANPLAWSGFVDMDINIPPATNFNNLRSTGSHFNLESTILGHLFPNMGSPGLIFMEKDNYYRNIGGVPQAYQIDCIYQANGCFFSMNILAAGNLLGFQANATRANGQMIYSEFYQLAGSAYAVVPDANTHTVVPGGTPVWNLTLHADYQPWTGENYTNAASQSLLLRNVSVFRVKHERNSLRIKLCTIEATSAGTEISICKEKAVMR